VCPEDPPAKRWLEPPPAGDPWGAEPAEVIVRRERRRADALEDWRRTGF
jgi:hypothetical protein